MRRSRIVVGALIAASGCEFTPPDLRPIDAPPVPIDIGIDVDTGGRVIDDHLIAVWRFDDATGGLARDTVRTFRPGYDKQPMDLFLETPAAYTWVPGGLRIDTPATIRTAPENAARPHMTPDVMSTKAVTFEVWVTPKDAIQGTVGYTTIFGLANNSSYCNIRLTQLGDHFGGEARTTNAIRGPEMPALSADGTVSKSPSHLVIVSDGTTRRLYFNGQEYDAPAPTVGEPSGWIENFRLSLGGDFAGGAPWLGFVWFAAVYDRALSKDEILKNYVAGEACTAC